MKGTLFQGAEGRIYYCIQRGLHRYSFYEFVGKDSFQLVNLEGLPEKDITGTHSSEYGLLCDTNEDILYQYSLEDSGWKVLMQWGDTDMNHPNTNSNLIVQIDEYRILTCLEAGTGNLNMREFSVCFYRDSLIFFAGSPGTDFPPFTIHHLKFSIFCFTSS